MKYDTKFWENWERLHPESYRHLLIDLQVYEEWKKTKKRKKGKNKT